MHEKLIKMNFTNKTSCFFTVLLLATSCVSPQALIQQGFDKMSQNQYDKAEKKFAKVLRKESDEARVVHDQAYHGMSVLYLRKDQLSTAKEYEYKAYRCSEKLLYIYNLARFEAQEGNRQVAYDWLFRLAHSNSEQRNRYATLAFAEPMFKSLKYEAKFNRLWAGYRRIAISILEGYSTESDKMTENDQFVVVSAFLLNQGVSKIILCTTTIENDNQARWQNEFVVFDYKLGTEVTISQYDQDYTANDLLSRGSMILPLDLSWNTIIGRRSHVIFRIQDIEMEPQTTNSDLPRTP
jgi:tetratricopeptide (TPR) repeat protein